MFGQYSPQTRGRRTKAEILDGAQAVESRFVARNTVEWKDADGARHIRLHRTDILTFHPDGSIRINTGGWNTITTRDRINAFLPSPFRVWTHRGQLHIAKGRHWNRGPNDPAPVPFRETVDIGPRGAVKPDTGPDNRRAERDRKLVDGYMAKIKAMGTIPFPDGGDPWIPVNPESGKYPEDIMREWLREKYVFGESFRRGRTLLRTRRHGSPNDDV